MKKYVNGGIVKEISIFYNKDSDKRDILYDLSDMIDLGLYNVNTFDNCMILELKNDILKDNIVSFLMEMEEFISPVFYNTKDNIKYLMNNLFNDDIDTLLKKCDDIFKDRYRFYDTFSINSNKCKIDILYYGFYFDGPYNGGNFNTFLRYFHKLHLSSINNILKGAICFGIN